MNTTTPALLLVASLCCSAGVAVAAPCSVPGSHATLAAALANPSCDPITLGSGDFAASLAIDRAVTISGSGSANSRLRGAAELEVLSLLSPAAVHLQDLGLLVHADTLTPQALSKETGATLSMAGVTITTAAPVPPPAPLTDAIALWNFANQVDSAGRESDFNAAGTFELGRQVVFPPGFAANADGFAGAEGPGSDCFSFGERSSIPAGHELALATAGSVSMWARVRYIGLDAVNDIFRFGDGNDPNLSSYELEIVGQNARFAVLGLGQVGESAVVHGSVLSPGQWYDVAGVFDAATQQIRVSVYDPNIGHQVGSSATAGVPFTSLGLGANLNLLFLEAPFNVNGCNVGGEIEGAAVWARSLTPTEVQMLSQGPGVIFSDGFEAGNTGSWSAVVP